LELGALLEKYTGLAVRPSESDAQYTSTDDVRLIGRLAFRSVEMPGLPQLEISYRLKIVVPRSFPEALPRVYAVDGCIPRDYHTNPAGDLCLGAQIHLRAIVRRNPTLLGFVDGCLVPYLYRRRYIEVFKTEPWGELEHGSRGLLHYYRHILGTKSARACVGLLRLGAMRRRIANKLRCPCGSGERVGRCHNRRINGLRSSCGRRALREAQAELERQIAIEPQRIRSP
jgi:hypothetical protein